MKFLVALTLLMFSLPKGFPVKKIKFSKGHSLKVEIAKTYTERMKGLMGRTHLEKNSGILFISNQPQRQSFWMKDTFIPLSIAYMDKNGVIKEIYEMKPQKMMEKQQDLKTYPSRCLCLYALEVNRGWFKRNNVKVGDRFSFID